MDPYWYHDSLVAVHPDTRKSVLEGKELLGIVGIVPAPPHLGKPMLPRVPLVGCPPWWERAEVRDEVLRYGGRHLNCMKLLNKCRAFVDFSSCALASFMGMQQDKMNHDRLHRWHV